MLPPRAPRCHVLCLRSTLPSYTHWISTEHRRAHAKSERRHHLHDILCRSHIQAFPFHVSCPCATLQCKYRPSRSTPAFLFLPSTHPSIVPRTRFRLIQQKSPVHAASRSTKHRCQYRSSHTYGRDWLCDSTDLASESLVPSQPFTTWFVQRLVVYMKLFISSILIQHFPVVSLPASAKCQSETPTLEN